MIRIDVHSKRLTANFEIQQGALLAVTGPTGSGKTTLLRMLAGLTQPAQGYMAVEEVVWLDTTRKSCLSPQKRPIGMVFQDYALFPHMSVMEQMRFALSSPRALRINDSAPVASASPAVAGSAPDRIHFLLESLDLMDLQHHKPSRLSGGQRQRAALARALVSKPSVLLLDEPFSAQDPLMKRRLEMFLMTLQKQDNFTTVLVTHDPSPIRHIADWAIWLEEGRILQQGRPTELFGRIYDIY